MKLSVAANYDGELAAELAGFPVAEVYGKFPADLVGGGRPSYMGTPLTKRDLAAYVAELERHDISFNYLLNSSCLGNREWSRAWQKKLMRLLDRLGTAWAIRRLTVSTPYLLERIKAAFPEFYVKVGIYAQIDTPRRARFWRDLGADALTLESFSINRDFDHAAGDPPGRRWRAATDREPSVPAELRDAAVPPERLRPQLRRLARAVHRLLFPELHA